MSYLTITEINGSVYLVDDDGTNILCPSLEKAYCLSMALETFPLACIKNKIDFSKEDFGFPILPIPTKIGTWEALYSHYTYKWEKNNLSLIGILEEYPSISYTELILFTRWMQLHWVKTKE